MGSDIGDLKREVFFRLLELAGRVMVVVRHSAAARIGRRGFTEEEKQNGLVLVFNSGMDFVWDSTGIHATLVFSSMPEKCYIPPENVVAVYSPELRVQFTAEPEEICEEDKDRAAPTPIEAEHLEGNIIKVDFTKKGGGDPDGDPGGWPRRDGA